MEMKGEIKIKDNTKKILHELKEMIPLALSAIGARAETLSKIKAVFCHSVRFEFSFKLHYVQNFFKEKSVNLCKAINIIERNIISERFGYGKNSFVGVRNYQIDYVVF